MGLGDLSIEIEIEIELAPFEIEPPISMFVTIGYPKKSQFFLLTSLVGTEYLWRLGNPYSSANHWVCPGQFRMFVQERVHQPE